MESTGKKPRRRRSFTPEFKAEIIELCQRGDRSAGQVTRDFDLTETAVREWVKQAERDAETRQDGDLTSAKQRELAELRRENRRLQEDMEILKRATAFLRQGDPVNCYPLIEAEKAQQRNVKRACELLKVSRAAYYAARDGQLSGRDREDAGLTAHITAEHKRSRGRYGAPRIHAELRRRTGHQHRAHGGLARPEQLRPSLQGPLRAQRHHLPQAHRYRSRPPSSPRRSLLTVGSGPARAKRRA
jgi:transposase